VVVSLVVQKYGGTSVADPSRIKAVADHIVATRQSGSDVLVVVSAMGATTDELERLAHDVSPSPAARELDMLLTAGERISMALLCMAILDRGEHAVSFTGSQAGIMTDTSHGRARIVEVRGDRLRDTLASNAIAVVAGFQGVSTTADITTLGRGGSDTTAVALAAALGADVCEIYTDVAGVFSADPRIVPDARKLPFVSFEEMLEMAASGAKVLQLRAVEYARNHGVRIHCRSSFEDAPGTVVLPEGETMEQPLITAVTHSTSESRITLVGVPDEPGIAARIFAALAEANVNVDMIVQNEPASRGGRAEISFTIPREDLRDASAALEPLRERVFTEMSAIEEMGKVSIVGAGMRSHPGVAARVFGVLAREGINIEMISTSPIKISCVIARGRVERAVQVLHEAFELSGPETISEEDPFG
jgi:aspartate kinase